MTSKDGDRLRELKDELDRMALSYGAGSQTQRDLYSIGEAVAYVLSGRSILVNPRVRL